MKRLNLYIKDDDWVTLHAVLAVPTFVATPSDETSFEDWKLRKFVRYNGSPRKKFKELRWKLRRTGIW